MFNFAAEQIFVVQPRNTGGGILSLLLSFDSLSASINFQNVSIQQKLSTWKQHLNKLVSNAHMHGHINFCSPAHNSLIESADFSNRYIHKLHFYELMSDDSKILLHQMLGRKMSVGIYLTEKCAEKLMQLRPHTDTIDYYQLWVYSNQKKLLLDYFGIESVHTWAFSDMLDADIFMDHLKYCEQCLELELDQNLCYQVIKDWLDMLHRSS